MVGYSWNYKVVSFKHSKTREIMKELPEGTELNSYARYYARISKNTKNINCPKGIGYTIS